MIAVDTESLRQWLAYFEAQPAGTIDAQWLDVLRELIERRTAAGVP